MLIVILVKFISLKKKKTQVKSIRPGAASFILKIHSLNSLYSKSKSKINFLSLTNIFLILYSILIVTMKDEFNYFSANSSRLFFF